jgi:DNA-binding transcriptional LysR family regulator
MSDRDHERAWRPPRSPQLEELKLFCAAAELGSVGRAAKRAHITQPGASKRLHALEALVGTPLFERSARGVTLTAAGERLYAHARRVAADVEELLDVIADINGQRQAVRLAISHTAAEYLMPRALVLMHHRTSAPVEVLSANSRIVKRMLRDGLSDVGVAACMIDESPSELECVSLLEDEIVVAVPLGHPWARRRAISTHELLSTPIVQRDPAAHTRQVVEEALERHSLAPIQAALEVGSTQAAKEEAHELCLPTILSRLAFSVADRLEIVPVEGLELKRRFCVLYPPGALPAAAASLIEAFKESAAALADRSTQRDLQSD